MPYSIEQSGSGYVVVTQGSGRKHSRRPLPRARAAAQMRALYANETKASTKAAGHTGVMIALFVPSSALPAVTALQAGLQGPEPLDDLHLTLAFLGNSAELLPQAALLDELLSSMYWDGDFPLSGTLGGIGRFHHDEGNGTNAVYASFDSPALPAFRQRLVEMLKGRGIMPAENHGFTPHITLAYVPVGTDIPTMPPEGSMPTLTFEMLTLAWGDERITYGPGTASASAKLRGMLGMKAANFGARAGERIVGNLGRGAGGQFTSAGAAPAKQPAATVGGITRSGDAPARRSESGKRRVARPGVQVPGQAAPEQPVARPAKPGKGRTRTRAMQTNRRRVAAELKKAGTGVGPRSMAALDAIRRDRPGARTVTSEHAKTLEILRATGMVRKFEDGSFELTESGKAFMDAADRGDTKAARAAITAKRAHSEKQPAKQKSLQVFKDAAGRWRWLTFSSTAFRDRDGEIVSSKALADDVARADGDGDYGPLRWWHVPQLDIGDCDFNAMHGRTLIESGTFRQERYGPLIAANADELGVSLGFKHAPDQPDGSGVFHSIHRFERSLLPVAYPSNLYTALVVKENLTVDEKKIAGLKALGFDDETIAGLQAQAAAREKAAEAAGVAFKEAELTAEAEIETPDPVYVGDLTPDQFVELQQRAYKPLLDAIAGTTATKEAKEQETQGALKATQDAIAGLQTALRTNGEAVDAKLGQAMKAIAELQGDVPAGVKRASQDAATVLSKEQVAAIKGPGPDPMAEFLGFVTTGGAG